MRLTELEYRVLQSVARKEDPWRGCGHGVGSRSVSQAISRLKRKGACVTAFELGVYAKLTEAGAAYLVDRCVHPGVKMGDDGKWLCTICNQSPPPTDIRPAGKISEPKA